MHWDLIMAASGENKEQDLWRILRELAWLFSCLNTHTDGEYVGSSLLFSILLWDTDFFLLIGDGFLLK